MSLWIYNSALVWDQGKLNYGNNAANCCCEDPGPCPCIVGGVLDANRIQFNPTLLQTNPAVCQLLIANFWQDMPICQGSSDPCSRFGIHYQTSKFGGFQIDSCALQTLPCCFESIWREQGSIGPPPACDPVEPVQTNNCAPFAQGTVRLECQGTDVMLHIGFEVFDPDPSVLFCTYNAIAAWEGTFNLGPPPVASVLGTYNLTTVPGTPSPAVIVAREYGSPLEVTLAA